MRICFNMRGVGLANNGGSRTLIRCVETLRELGHDAFFHTGKVHYTWHKPNIKCIGGDEHPPCDVTIATGYNSYKHVARYTDAKRACFMRVLETWQASERELLAKLKAIPNRFVNSEWQKTYLTNHGMDSVVQYPGLDWEWFNNSNLSRNGVGGLMHNKAKRKRSKDCEELEKILGLSFQYLNRHIKRPDSVTLNKWYNRLKVWFAPTELEGLHNPPTEAAMAGCALVCTDHPRSGMCDYAIHEETALVYPARDLEVAADYVRRLLSDEVLRVKLNRNMVALLAHKMGNRKDRMEEFAIRLEQCL